MILEIESVYGDAVIHGKRFSESELRAKIKEVLSVVGERDFPRAFCMRFGYEPVTAADGVDVDYTVDLDTHLVVKHIY